MEREQDGRLPGDDASWRGWLGGKVANAEAALASVFTNECAISPAAAQGSQLEPHTEHDDESFLAARMSRTTSGLSFSEAWCAVRRAAAAAMGSLEQMDGSASRVDATGVQEQQEQDGVSDDGAVVSLQQRAVLDNYKLNERNVAPKGSLAHLSMSDCSEMEQLGKDVQLDAYEDNFAALEQNHGTDGCAKHTKQSTRCDKHRSEICECMVSEERVAQLKRRFDMMFEQNGGAECVARVKEIGDTQLMGMRDCSRMDSRVLEELCEAKRMLDKALCSLEMAARKRVDESGEAASAAASVIEQTKENVKREEDLVDDCSRLLAVFASKVCANVLRCVEERDAVSWSGRVQQLVHIASVGVGQLRTICFSFAAELPPPETCTPVLKDVSVRHVLQCVALAVAAFHVEAAERAVECSVQL